VNFGVSGCTNFRIFRGSAPHRTAGAYSASPDPLAGGEGARCTALSLITPPCSRPLGFFSFYLSICGLRKGPGKISDGGPGKVLDFLSVKEWEPCNKLVHSAIKVYLTKLAQYVMVCRH